METLSMNYWKNIFIVLFLLLFISISNDGISQKYSKKELLEDFEIFEGSLKDFHPGLYFYTDPSTIDSIFRQAKKEISDSLTGREFQIILSNVISQIGCGHTDVSATAKTRGMEMTHFLPLKLYFQKTEAYFIKPYVSSKIDLAPGDQVIAINNIKVDSIASLILSVTSGDGIIKTGKYNELNSYFWYLFTYYFGSSKSYQIKYKDSIGEVLESTVEAIDRTTIFNAYKKDQQTKESRNLALSYFDNQSIAYLKIKAFFDWKEGKKTINFNKRLTEIFEELDHKNINKLIIDIRDNGGGKEPWRLFAHFHSEPIQFAKSARYIYSKESQYLKHQKLHPSMKFLKRNNKLFPGANKAEKLNDSTFQLTNLYLVKPFKPLKPQFKNKVIVLTDGGSFSAAALFASQMKSQNKAIFVGEETGGSYYGNTSMNPTYVTLPNTSIEIEIPLVNFLLDVTNNEPLGRGIIPDYPISISAEDIIQANDSQLEFALELYRKGKINN